MRLLGDILLDSLVCQVAALVTRCNGSTSDHGAGTTANHLVLNIMQTGLNRLRSGAQVVVHVIDARLRKSPLDLLIEKVCREMMD